MTMRGFLKTASALALVVLLGGALPDSPVADAAMRGDRALVRSLISKGENVNLPQGDGMTALHWAAFNGDAELTELLVKSRAKLDAVTRNGAYTPLHLATREGHEVVANRLISAGSNVKAATTTGAVTALHFAARAGDAAVISALLDRGADINARETAWGQTPLIFAAASNRVEAMKVLLKRGADVKVTTSVLDLAARDAADRAGAQKRKQVLDEFKRQSPDTLTWRPTPAQVQAAIKAGQEAQTSEKPAQSAAPEPEVAAGEEVAGFSGSVGTQGGFTALLHSVREGFTEATLALLDAGADLNQVSAGDHTSPLLMATINGHFDLASVLLDRGANPNLASDAGATPLFTTINTQWAPKSRYPQQQAYTQQKLTYLELMAKLLDKGADPNVRLKKHLWYMSYTFDLLGIDARGATPFWRAAYATDVAAMKLLVARGADPNIPTLNTPRARRGGGGQGAQAGAAAGRAGAAGGGRGDPSGLPPVPADGPAVWPIHAASGVGYGEGYAANAHRHAPDAWLPSVKYLIEVLGADVNARDHNGYNAVHHAAARGDNELILYLVSKGADVTAVSRRGQTTADMANGPQQRISPFPETIALLEKLGSKNNHRCLSC